MSRPGGRDLIHRSERNPLISIEDLPFRCIDICNAGAVRVADEYILLLTIQSLEGFYFIYPARSRDGYDFEVSEQPLMAPSREGPFGAEEELGVLDPRIVRLDDVYYIAYDVLGEHGFRLGLGRTEDFRTVERVGLVSEPDTKAGVLFPKKIKGKYARLERPSEGKSIWISFSEDLEYWGWSEVVMTPRGGFWDSDRIGVAGPPVETDLGWLISYYGVKGTSAGPLYRLGAAILDVENPARLVKRTNVPILSPREDYERLGDVTNLVFLCGWIIELDNQVKLYYGAANSCICLGTAKLEDIFEACLGSEREF